MHAVEAPLTGRTCTGRECRWTRTNSHDRTLKSILIAGIAVSCFYWVCESFMFFFLAPEANFIQHLLGPDMFNTWTRLLVLCLFAIFGSHIQYTINKEREADEALRESEAKYRVILESIEEGVFEIRPVRPADLFQRPIRPDPGVPRLGTATDEHRGLHDSGVGGRGRTDPAAHRNERRVGHHPRLHGDRRADGTRRQLELSVSRTADAAGRPTGFRCVARDVTERLNSDLEKKKLEAQLQMAQKMEAIGTLAGGIAHDFNNILMGIQGNASLLEMRLDANHPGRDKIKNIEKYVESGTELSRQLLGFARRGKYNVKASDINDIIDKTSSMFARTRKEIRVRTQLAEGAWTVEVDRGQIEQALLNLYINAWQAMPDGGELYLATENLTLDENYVRPYSVKAGPYVKVTVADTGVGIDREDLAAHLRAVLHDQGDGPRHGARAGLGLRHRQEPRRAHQRLQRTGAGHDVQLLPAGLDARGRRPRSRSRTTALRRGSETVLLIDDEEMILDVGSRPAAGARVHGRSRP